jgi:hypothetical protein
MPGRVDHVVNFDFPRNPIDYIHRAGRSGFDLYAPPLRKQYICLVLSERDNQVLS